MSIKQFRVLCHFLWKCGSCTHLGSKHCAERDNCVRLVDLDNVSRWMILILESPNEGMKYLWAKSVAYRYRFGGSESINNIHRAHRASNIDLLYFMLKGENTHNCVENLKATLSDFLSIPLWVICSLVPYIPVQDLVPIIDRNVQTHYQQATVLLKLF